MKTIGMLGGLSWESSAAYYRLVNELAKEQLGGFHSAQIIMLSCDFAEIEALQASGAWDEATERMVAAAVRQGRGRLRGHLLAHDASHRR